MSKWKWIAASQRGTSHEKADIERQDAFRCVEASGGRLIAAISDGAGSASHSRYGAVITCRLLTAKAVAHGRLPNPEIFEHWIDELRDNIARTACRHSLEMRDFAATMLFAVSDEQQLFTAHIGDGAIVRQAESLGPWECVSWPENGEYASTTFFITDSAGVRLRMQTFDSPTHALALFSDGIERLVLNFATKTTPGSFFDSMANSMKDCINFGYQRELSRQLCVYLNSDPINERTDDDKTLIVAVRR